MQFGCSYHETFLIQILVRDLSQTLVVKGGGGKAWCKKNWAQGLQTSKNFSSPFPIKIMDQTRRKASKLNFHCKICGNFFQDSPLQYWVKFLRVPLFAPGPLTSICDWSLNLTFQVFNWEGFKAESFIEEEQYRVLLVLPFSWGQGRQCFYLGVLTSLLFYFRLPKLFIISKTKKTLRTCPLLLSTLKIEISYFWPASVDCVTISCFCNNCS